MLAITSCQDELISSYDQRYVRFKDVSQSVAESTILGTADKVDSKVGSTFNVTIFRSTSDFGSSQEVSFSVSSQYLSDSEFADAGDDASDAFRISVDGAGPNYTVTIPAGEASTSFVFRTIDDLFASGDKEVVFALSGAGSFDLGVGESEIGKSLKLTIVDDDCPINIADWVGTYMVEERFTGGVNAPNGLKDFFGESYRIQFALDPTDGTGTKVIITNVEGFNEYVPDGTVMTFVTCPKQVSFDAGPPLIAVFRNFVFTESVYDEASFKVTCRGPLATFGPYEFVWTKMQ